MPLFQVKRLGARDGTPCQVRVPGGEILEAENWATRGCRPDLHTVNSIEAEAVPPSVPLAMACRRALPAFNLEKKRAMSTSFSATQLDGDESHADNRHFGPPTTISPSSSAEPHPPSPPAQHQVRTKRPASPRPSP